MGEITADAGRVTQSNFHNYPVARSKESPRKIDVTIVDSKAPHAGVGEQGARTALDVDPAVGARGARQVRDRIQLFLALDQVQGQRLQARGALLEVQRHQARHARLARIRDGFVEVDLFPVRVIDDTVVQGAVQGHGGAFAQPAAGDQALQRGYVSHVVSP